VDGVLIIDKPEGMTSHDVVAVARRSLRESRIGHTGTLDPLATGVLPLAIGRATRLVRFLTASDKTYEATIRFGVTTDSYDVTGEETSRTDRHPTEAEVEAALPALRGDYLQMPPAFSAKKVGGRRAYELARKQEPVDLTPVPVRVSEARLTAFDGWTARLTLTVSSGFYVRSFAHALGLAVTTGACLEALQRTRSGEFRLEEAMSLETLQAGRDAVVDWAIPLERLLTAFPSAVVTEEGRLWIGHGRTLGPAQLEAVSLKAVALEEVSRASAAAAPWTRLLDGDGRLVALAEPGKSPGSLHPSIVLT